MVIHNLNVAGVASFEPEAHPPLIIDSNAPTPFPVALQSFQPVPGGLLKSAIAFAESSICNFRSATTAIDRNPLGDLFSKRAWVSLHRKLLIITWSI